MKKSWMVFALIFTIIFLITSCSGQVASGENARDTEAILKQVQSGTQGVTMSFLQDSPPAVVYDQNELLAIVEVKNKGNHDLAAQDCFIQITGFDPNIISPVFGVARSCAEGLGLLEGKSVFNTDGGFNQLEFSSTNIILPDGILEYNPNLNFVTCYNYVTRANPQVCIDTALYQVTAEQKTCKVRDISMSGGQGAPVSVSKVTVEMAGTQAIFGIDIVNNGGGRVLHPQTDIQSCAQATQLTHRDLDKIEFTVSMPGAAVNCNPTSGIVPLNNGKGKIICKADMGISPAFETPLQIVLNYNYIQSMQKKIKIISTPR